MPFDASLVLANDDGEWTEANLVGSNDYGTPVSTVRNTGGLVIVDIKQTGANGMVAVLIIDEAGAATDDALTVVLQASDSSTFASGIQTLANFEVAGAVHGVIRGDECPCTVMRRFATKKRYVRIDASCVVSDNFHTVWCLLSPYPFETL